MGEKASANIYDIAEQAGVSIATVSRVLSGSGNVREETRRKVLDAMERLHYLPNAFARGLGLGSMGMVGVLCTDVADIFYAQAVSVLERQLRREGLDALLCCTGTGLEDKKRGMDLLLKKHVDAMILVGSAFKEQSDNSHIAAAAEHVPVVIVNGLVECPNTYCVLCDEEKAVYDTACKLFHSGCRHPLYLYDVLTFSGTQKLSGLRRALRDCGIPPEDCRIFRVDKDLRSVRALVSGTLDEFPALDGMMASEDLLAVGALQAFAERNLRIPAVGFNNSLLAECVTPRLTSVDNLVESLCITACGILSSVLNGKDAASIVTLNARLVERETFRTAQKGL